MLVVWLLPEGGSKQKNWGPMQVIIYIERFFFYDQVRHSSTAGPISSETGHKINSTKKRASRATALRADGVPVRVDF